MNRDDLELLNTGDWLLQMFSSSHSSSLTFISHIGSGFDRDLIPILIFLSNEWLNRHPPVHVAASPHPLPETS